MLGVSVCGGCHYRSPADILAGAKAQLADCKVPDWLDVVDEIPGNAPGGETDRKSLLARTSNPGIRRDG